MHDFEPGHGWPSPDEPGATIWKAQRAVVRAVDACLTGLGLSSALVRILRLLDLGPGQSAADLARRLGFAPQSVAAVVERAELAGFLTRRPHPVHGRVRQLFLTDAGRDAYDRAAEVLRAVEQDLATGLDGAGRDLLSRQLIAVADRANQLAAAAPAGTPSSRPGEEAS